MMSGEASTYAQSYSLLCFFLPSFNCTITWSKSMTRIRLTPLLASMCAAWEPTPPSPTTTMKASWMGGNDASPKKERTRAKSSCSRGDGREEEEVGVEEVEEEGGLEDCFSRCRWWWWRKR